MLKFNHLTVKLFVLALFCVALAGCKTSGGGTETANQIAATVNGKEISLTEVDNIISVQTNGRQGEMTPLQMGGARLQVLSKLIEEEVMFQKAEKEKFLPTDEEINRAIEDGKKGQTQEAFDKFLKDQNLTPDTFRDKIKRQLAVSKMQEKYTSGIEIKDKEVEEAYNSNKEAFVKRRGAELAMIVVDAKDNGAQDDAKSVAEAQIKIKDIATQLQQGADFADLARRRSEDPSNAQGGDLGFIDEAQMQQQFNPQFAALIMSKKAGDIIGPIGAGDRAIIFKVKSVQTQNENLTLESPGVREQATEALRGQRKQLVLAAMGEMAINEARIVNYIAESIVQSPNTLGMSRFAQPPSTATPSASPSGSPSASPAGSPAAAASPAASPAAKATPATAASPATKASPAK